MAARLEIYKCEKCGNIVEVLHDGVGELVCCGEPMKRMVENTVDASLEKHVPVIEKIARRLQGQDRQRAASNAAGALYRVDPAHRW